ncbi:unnamed protein product [Brassicogethes aeneus]|uniref:Uncharacterized protein n=1 Tax=Brassicogethes aeneus TaxID=1431903 RepID=A0A9P0FQL6_BRAAE|nr:unnamed protein product [Brassicogethes aeneus]
MIRHLLITLVLLMICISITEGKSSSSPTKNHELMKSLGLKRVRGPNSHHRKRLAVESRHHSRSDDSHMFIIKLPPNPHYYAHNMPNAVEQMHSKNVPVGFKSNGKPAKVYHWNLPVVKKITSVKHKKRYENSNSLDYHNLDNWNEVLEKNEPERKPIKPSYYIPVKPKKSNVMKYFAGNGKPHSFYVIEKSKKAHYHRLLP